MIINYLSTLFGLHLAPSTPIVAPLQRRYARPFNADISAPSTPILAPSTPIGRPFNADRAPLQRRYMAPSTPIPRPFNADSYSLRLARYFACEGDGSRLTWTRSVVGSISQVSIAPTTWSFIRALRNPSRNRFKLAVSLPECVRSHSTLTG